MVSATIFHENFKTTPFWWEAFHPSPGSDEQVPTTTTIAIIGAGYTGLATARELHELGIEATVFDAEEPGIGASTRSGGLVSGAVSIKPPIIADEGTDQKNLAMMSDAHLGLEWLEYLIDTENINCGWTKKGLFIGAWSKKHLSKLQDRANQLNQATPCNARTILRDQQREYIGSDFYHGGLYVENAGHLHPALYYEGMLNACKSRKVTICGNAAVQNLKSVSSGWLLKTSRGDCRADEVVIATNGYTGDLTPDFKRRLIPLRAYIITTEKLDPMLAASLSPGNSSFTDSKRITSFFRLWEPENRLVYGSRMRWRDISPDRMAPLLYSSMLERFPQLAGTKITHAWTGSVALTLDERPHIGDLKGMHFALGCNGAGVSNMTYLGTQLARRIAQTHNYQCAFDDNTFPIHPLYTGKQRWALPVIGNLLRFRDWWDRQGK